MKIIRSTVLLLSFIIISGPVALSQITEKAGFGQYALTNATIHTVTDGVIESGIVLVDGEEIAFVGENARIGPDYIHMDLTGKHIYPGFIDSGTQLGLREVGAISVTLDDAEVGDYNPQVKAFTAINPASVAIPVTRVNGVTTVISQPTSGIFSGKSTLIDLYGYSPDSMAVLKESASHLNWPSATATGPWDQRDEDEIRQQYEERLDEVNEFWQEAETYHKMWSRYEQSPQGKQVPDKDYVMEGMRNVFSGDLPIMVSVDKEKDILEALKWIDGKEEISFILSSVEEGWRVADEIAESGIPCLVGPMLELPSREYDNYQRPYQNAGLLHNAGVLVALRTGETENVRNLNYNAGYAATYGLGVGEALKAVTINPARIFGVDDRIGSIEAGKQANLLISDGDPFEALTTIEQVFIKGYKIPMVSRQTQLFEEYLNRDQTRN
ncbi:MAG: amidohydrolase family protein [Balneolales bacterium]